MSGPPKAAIEYGHDLAWDPPAFSAAERWTCTNDGCGAVAIRYQGNEYGSATERTCDEERSRQAVLGKRGRL
jgi:hypothetical protein